jgi:hypothetical protein
MQKDTQIESDYYYICTRTVHTLWIDTKLTLQIINICCSTLQNNGVWWIYIYIKYSTVGQTGVKNKTEKLKFLFQRQYSSSFISSKLKILVGLQNYCQTSLRLDVTTNLGDNCRKKNIT